MLYRSRSPFILALIPIGIGFLVLASLGLRDMGHANAKHVESPAIRIAARQGACRAKELWFAPASGRVLILCELESMSPPENWGGWIVYVTQNNGSELVTPHEATCFVSTRGYWSYVVERDGYLPLANYPRLLDHVTDSLGLPLP